MYKMQLPRDFHEMASNVISNNEPPPPAPYPEKIGTRKDTGSVLP